MERPITDEEFKSLTLGDIVIVEGVMWQVEDGGDEPGELLLESVECPVRFRYAKKNEISIFDI